MAKADELKRRAERLLAGEMNTRDLSALFLWLREHSFGNRAVVDVGDFVAHSEERDKGIAWTGIQHFFNTAQYHLPHRTDPDAEFDLDQFKRSARSAFELTPPDLVREESGLGKNKARRVLESALLAVLTMHKGETFVGRALTPKEDEILRLYSTAITVAAAFTGEMLASQFLVCLAKNKLIDAAPRVPPEPFASFVALFAVERMHGALIRLQDNAVAKLEACAVCGSMERIDVLATVAPFHKGKFMPVGFSIYTTNLKPKDWCAPELLPEPFELTIRWKVPLEIGLSGKLQKL